MKAKSHFLTLIPLYFIIFFSFFWIIIYSHHLENQYYKKLTDMPILVYAYNQDQLNVLKENLDSNSSIMNTQIQTNDNLKKGLIDKYNLSGDELIQSARLPHLLIIRFKGSEKLSFIKILQQIRTNYPDFLLDYNVKGVDELFDSLNQFKLLRSRLIYIMLLMVLLIMFYSRSFYEMANMDYWRVYIRAGGDISKRHKSFTVNSLILYVSGTLLSLSVALYASNQLSWQESPIMELTAYMLKNPLILLVLSLPIVADVLCFIYLRRKI